jgi:KDO2-lipid IV(A) lauroyltransferase
MAEGQGVFVEFFGRPAATTTIVAALAVKTGSQVLVGESLLLPDGRYRLVYHPPLAFEPREGEARDAAITRLTQQIARLQEDVIREHPEQWLWLHRRWKTQP